MTENNQEICANCGKTREEHPVLNDKRIVGMKRGIFCKKFVPKNHSSKEQKRLESGSYKMQSECAPAPENKTPEDKLNKTEENMTQGKASKEEAKECSEALNEVMKAFPKSKVGEFIGHFNDIFLFLSACEKDLPSEDDKSSHNLETSGVSLSDKGGKLI